jgi:hypothetical protein
MPPPRRRTAAETRKEATVRTISDHRDAGPRRGAGQRPSWPAGPFDLLTVLGCYVAIAFVLLTAVLAVRSPQRGHAGAPGTPAAPWDYQQEQVTIQGRGVLNAYARWAITADAWAARGSIERQRDLYRLNLLDYAAGEPAAGALAGWRQRERVPLEGATIALALGLAAYGVLRRPAGRAWVLALLLLASVTLALTRPITGVRLAAAPTVALPNATLGAVVRGSGPGGLGVTQAGERAREEMAARYWSLSVSRPLSRLQTGTPILAGARPAQRGGVLAALRRQVGAVNDWAGGRHGLERAVIASLALAYLLPFAVLLAAGAMVAACAQTIVYVLLLGGPFVAPLALWPRWRRPLLRWWLTPLVGAAALLALATLGSLLVFRVGELLRGSDEEVSLLLAGSVWPLLLAVLVRWKLVRRRNARRPAAAEGGTA